MNSGIATGYVYHADGTPASGFYVNLRRVEAQGERLDIQPSGDGKTLLDVEATTDARGKFAIPFTWSGAQFADDILSTQLQMVLVAMNNVHGVTTEHGRTRVRAYLTKDIAALLDSTSPILSDNDIQSYVPDLSGAIKKFLPEGAWNTAALTTESWLIFGIAEINL